MTPTNCCGANDEKMWKFSELEVVLAAQVSPPIANPTDTSPGVGCAHQFLIITVSNCLNEHVTTYQIPFKSETKTQL